MSSLKKQIEDAVIAILNAPGSPAFSTAFTAERGPVVFKKPQDVETLRVIVNAKIKGEERENRAKVGFLIELGIGVVQRVGFEADTDNGRINLVNAEAVYILTDEIAVAMQTNITGFDTNGPLKPVRDWEADSSLIMKGILGTTIMTDFTIWYPRNTRT